MEFINGNKKLNISKRTPHSLPEPIKISPFIIERTFDSCISLSNFILNQHDEKIKQVMKKSRFQYQSIFFIEKIYEDEPLSPISETHQETYETQSVYHEVQRKGVQFFQYSANNPIQDSLCSFQIEELNTFVISVFDGHGGSQLSRFCAKNTSKYLKNFVKTSMKLHKYENNKIQLIKDGLFQTYLLLENQYYKHYLKNISKDKKKYKGVGTCGITVVVFEDKVIIASCGDSQAMIVSEDRGSYNYEKLSQKFNLNNKSERLRLIEEFKDIDKDIIVEERKNVFYLKGMLQPTRSIGDYYLKHKQHYLGDDQFKGPYLSCQPDIKVYDIKQHDKHIIVASDGLWDYLTKWEVLKYLIQSKNNKMSIWEKETESENEEAETVPKQSVKYLGQKVLEKVSNDFDIDVNYLKTMELGERRSYHDDITIGIIDIREFLGGASKQH